jgi:phosphoesterase RecJ-like protein
MKNEDYIKFKDYLIPGKKCVVIPHRNPDGDAMGSTLALCFFLNKMGANAVVISPNEAPSFLQWLPGFESVVLFDRQKEQALKLIDEAELIFTLDFNDFSRTGSEMEAVLHKKKATYIMIDHHQQPSDYAEFMYSDTSMSSTSEMVYHFIDQIGALALIDKNIATCIYTGILTDTGQFKFPNTTATTHQIAAHLMELGVDHFKIHQEIYDTNDQSKLELLGCCLSSMEVLRDYNTAILKLSAEELEQHHYKKGDTEGLVNYGLSLKGIIFSVIFIEHKDEGIIKISFRSQGNFSVNEFARAHFEGGGHDNAAGGKSNDSLETTIERFKSLLPQYLEKLNQ